MNQSNDDQEWLEALAGRAAAGTPGVREGTALRAAIAEAAARPDHAEIPQDALREAQLIARARREGLLDSRGEALRRWWALGWSRGFAVAAIAGVAIALGLYLQAPIEVTDEVVRSAPDGVVRLQADDPVKLKRQIIEELQAAGVQATGYELLGRQGIDADLPRPLSDAVRRVLEKHRIAEPADGVLRIEITARGQE